MKRLLTLLLSFLLMGAAPAAPSLQGGGEWLNSPPLTLAGLRGKVVLVDFWTYSCINCLRTLPYLRAWSQKYGPQGLVVIGVHAPEFGFERDVKRVRQALMDGRLDYPVVLDNDFTIWGAFNNRAWPAFHFIDAQGRVRHRQFGEGDYEGAEKLIRELLKEAGKTPDAGMAQVMLQGIGAAPDLANMRSPETYLGHAHGAAPGVLPDRLRRYPGGNPRLNEWLLSGDWTVRSEYAESAAPAGGVLLRFHARDLHLVLGPAADGRPLPFRITIDGKAPGADAGVDADADGRGVIHGERLYQLVRQRGPVRERVFEIRFDAAGARTYAFSFG